MLLAIFKAAVGVVAGSVAIVMDAVNNLSDALSSVITIVGTKLSQRPADLKHPFGYGRIEYFSAIIIAVIVLSAGIASLIESVKKLFDPTEPTYTTVTLVVIVVSIFVKIALGMYVKRQGEQLKSDALVASGADALFDAVITLATLVSAGVMLMWGVSLDGILGSLISFVVIKAGLEMLASPIDELLGARVSAELVSQIKSEVAEFEGVLGVYDIILHNYGTDVMIGSLHVNLRDDMTAYEIHGLTRSITEAMYERHSIIMTVGVYAVATGDNRRAHIQTVVMEALAGRKDVLQVHGFYYFEKERRVSVDVVPDVSVKDEPAFARMLTAEIQPLLEGDTLSILIDHNYSA